MAAAALPPVVASQWPVVVVSNQEAWRPTSSTQTAYLDIHGGAAELSHGEDAGPRVGESVTAEGTYSTRRQRQWIGGDERRREVVSEGLAAEGAKEVVEGLYFLTYTCPTQISKQSSSTSGFTSP